MNRTKLLLTLTVILLFQAAPGRAQNPVTVADGRDGIEDKIIRMTPDNEAVLRRDALPAARKAFSGACEEAFSVVDTADGAFTKANAKQRAILYRFCETGHNFANNGLAILEGGQLAAHVVYEGAADYSLHALPDINGNGFDELVLSDGSTNQGYTAQVVALIELGAKGVRKFGLADIYADNCGAAQRCKSEAWRVTATRGATPAFFREGYRLRNKKWARTAKAAPFRLRADEVKYQRVK